MSSRPTSQHPATTSASRWPAARWWARSLPCFTAMPTCGPSSCTSTRSRWRPHSGARASRNACSTRCSRSAARSAAWRRGSGRRRTTCPQRASTSRARPRPSRSSCTSSRSRPACPPPTPREYSGVAEATVVRIAEALHLERRDDLADAVGHALRGLESQLGGDPLEAHLVVARILAPLHVGDLAAAQLARDELHEVELAVVLVGVADVEDAAADLARIRAEHEHHAAGGVAHVYVGAPELLAEDLEGPVGPEVAGELV